MEIKIIIVRKNKLLLETQFRVKDVEHFESIKSDIIFNIKNNAKTDEPIVIDPNTENSFILDCKLLNKSIVTLKLIK